MRSKKKTPFGHPCSVAPEAKPTFNTNVIDRFYHMHAPLVNNGEKTG
jgi:hypothetical protein